MPIDDVDSRPSPPPQPPPEQTAAPESAKDSKPKEKDSASGSGSSGGTNGNAGAAAAAAPSPEFTRRWNADGFGAANNDVPSVKPTTTSRAQNALRDRYQDGFEPAP